MQPMWKHRNTARHHGKYALRTALRKARRPPRHATPRRAFVQRHTQKEKRRALKRHITDKDQSPHVRMNALIYIYLGIGGLVLDAELAVEGAADVADEKRRG